jgi:hypothetical protein
MDSIEPGVTGRKSSRATPASPPSESKLGDDILYGAGAIAEYMNASKRQVYYWKKLGLFGLFDIGDNKIAGRKSRIVAELAKMEKKTDGP